MGSKWAKAHFSPILKPISALSKTHFLASLGGGWKVLSKKGPEAVPTQHNLKGRPGRVLWMLLGAFLQEDPNAKRNTALDFGAHFDHHHSMAEGNHEGHKRGLNTLMQESERIAIENAAMAHREVEATARAASYLTTIAELGHLIDTRAGHRAQAPTPQPPSQLILPPEPGSLTFSLKEGKVLDTALGAVACPHQVLLGGGG